MIKKSIVAIVLLILFAMLTSCQAYRSKFDCPPGKGVPCASVHEIEKMIVETDEGPDIFLFQPVKRESNVIPSTSASFKKGCLKRIWVNPSTTLEGDYVEGYYIYLSDEEI
jgi:hypothetical protein